MSQITSSDLELAKIIWDYNFLKEPVSQADCILVLGSHDIRIAHHACDLYHQGLASYIAFIGAVNQFTSKIYPSTEAEAFAAVAISRGIPLERIIVENRSRNTGENFLLTGLLLEKEQLPFQRFIILQIPNMLRRVKATALKLWPTKSFSVTSHAIQFEAGPHDFLTEEMFVHEIVGDLQRILVYPGLGFQIFQEVPPAVLQAYHSLVERGFTGNLSSPKTT